MDKILKESITKKTKRSIKLIKRNSDHYGIYWIIELGKIPNCRLSDIVRKSYNSEKMALRQYDYKSEYK